MTRKTDALQRLGYIEGHVHGIHKTLEAGTPCLDIRGQTYLMRRGPNKLDQILLRERLEYRLSECFREGREVLDGLAAGYGI